jgi:hypothetical protein
MKNLLALTVLALLGSFVAEAAHLRFFQSVPEEIIVFNTPPAGTFTLGFAQYTQFQSVSDGAYSWRFVNSTGGLLFEVEVPLFGDIYYTYVITKSNDSYALQTYYENLQGASSWTEGQALVRFIHLAPTQEPVSISQGSENILIVNSPYLRDTTYIPISANVPIVFTMNISGFIFDYSAGNLLPNTMYTIVLLSSSMNVTGNMSQDIQILLIDDRCYQNYTCHANATTGNSTGGVVSNSTVTATTGTRSTTGVVRTSTSGVAPTATTGTVVVVTGITRPQDLTSGDGNSATSMSLTVASFVVAALLTLM